jgi:hypothetical protein
MKRVLASAGICFAGLLTFTNAQVITFNQPAAWMSCRDGNIVVKALLDTGRLDNKSVDVSLYKVSGKKKTMLGSYTTKKGEYSQEFTLAKIKEKVVGGRDFLKIEWSVKGKNDKGNIQPFGIADIGTAEPEITASGKFISGNLDMASVIKVLEEKDFRSAGNSKFAVAWNEMSVAIVVKKNAADGNIQFCFDGKNGKNAFLSYPDRFVSFDMASDSVKSWYLARSVSDSGVVYTEKTWNCQIKKESDASTSVIIINWYDIGLVPFNGRMAGFCALSGKESIPKSANQEIPATWGNLLLVGGPEEKKE